MRLFVAAWPSRPVVKALQRLPRREIAGVRWTTEHQWHVTLRFLGDVEDPTPVAEALRTGLRDVVAADVVADRRARRFGPAVVGVPVHGLEPVAAAVAAATAAWGRTETRPFRGHLTLARCRGRAPAATLSIGLPVLQWRAEEVCLVRSHLHPTGAAYETIETCSLRLADPHA
jgi:2'-5' RNA ligase